MHKRRIYTRGLCATLLAFLLTIPPITLHAKELTNEEKAVLATFSLLSTIDVMQTTQGLKEGYKELNPLIKNKETAIGLNLLSVIGMYLHLRDNDMNDTRSAKFITALRGLIILNNHSVGVRIKL